MTDLTVTALTVPEVLRRAEQIIGERGWCQGDYTDEQGHVCLEGAINVAVWGWPYEDAYDDDGDCETATAAGTAVTEHVGRYFVGWNDEPERTEAEVRAALLAAAEKASES